MNTTYRFRHTDGGLYRVCGRTVTALYALGIEQSVTNQDLAEEIIGACRRKRSAYNRRMRDQAMRDMGMVKVRGALGGVYWE